MAKKDQKDSGEDLLAISLGRCIEKHRTAADLSMSKLASSAGMARAYLWRVEQGAMLPNLRNIARIAVALDVPIHRLLEGLDVSEVELANREYSDSKPER